jgi:hypothetical protein
VDTAKEEVGLWQALARSYPDKYQETYNRKVAELRRYLNQHGQESASIWLNLNNDGPHRDKPHHIPPATGLPEQ